MSNRRDDITAFGFIANEMGGGGDRGQSFPRSDAEDFSRGVRFVPREVTFARRRGERVEFIQRCKNSCCWYWQFRDGSRSYHFELYNYEQYGKDKCSLCGNVVHMGGGYFKKGDV